jgi:hypothetical protein
MAKSFFIIFSKHCVGWRMPAAAGYELRLIDEHFVVVSVDVNVCLVFGNVSPYIFPHVRSDATLAAASNHNLLVVPMDKNH